MASVLTGRSWAIKELLQAAKKMSLKFVSPKGMNSVAQGRRAAAHPGSDVILTDYAESVTQGRRLSCATPSG
jgi:hypothetical protein